MAYFKVLASATAGGAQWDAASVSNQSPDFSYCFLRIRRPLQKRLECRKFPLVVLLNQAVISDACQYPFKRKCEKAPAPISHQRCRVVYKTSGSVCNSRLVFYLTLIVGRGRQTGCSQNTQT